MYTFQIETLKYFRWRCVRRKKGFKGILKTDKDTKDTFLVVNHCHAPEKEEVAAHKIVGKMKEIAAKSDEA